MAEPSLGVYNQIRWPGVGDADDCWVIATFWVLVATGVMTRDQLPSVSAYRSAAGVVDRRGRSDGGSNSDTMKALRRVAPRAVAKLYSGGFAGFKQLLAKGYIASLSVNSGRLPGYLQFGFKGAHQVAIVLQGGKFYVMNPLAQQGSALLPISEADLMKAAYALLGDHRVHAVLIKAGVQKAVNNLEAMVKAARQLQPPPVEEEGVDFLDGWDAKRFYLDKHPRG